MNRELLFLFEKLCEELSDLPPNVTSKISESLHLLNQALARTDLPLNQKIESANQLANYLRKKSKEIGAGLDDSFELDMLKWSRALRHGKRLPPDVIRALYPVFWKTLTRTAREWPIEELSNILAYCLRIKPIFFDPNKLSPTRIVSSYKNICDAMPIEKRYEIFPEIMMRISGEPSFELYLMQTLKNRRASS